MTVEDHVISHVNISHAQEEDGGLYSCQAKNAMGVVTHSARLNIYGETLSPLANTWHHWRFIAICMYGFVGMIYFMAH